jgi:hypothetical protein
MVAEGSWTFCVQIGRSFIFLDHWLSFKSGISSRSIFLPKISILVDDQSVIVFSTADYFFWERREEKE